MQPILWMKSTVKTFQHYQTSHTRVKPFFCVSSRYTTQIALTPHRYANRLSPQNQKNTVSCILSLEGIERE